MSSTTNNTIRDKTTRETRTTSQYKNNLKIFVVLFCGVKKLPLLCYQQTGSTGSHQ